MSYDDWMEDRIVPAPGARKVQKAETEMAMNAVEEEGTTEVFVYAAPMDSRGYSFNDVVVLQEGQQDTDAVNVEFAVRLAASERSMWDDVLLAMRRNTGLPVASKEKLASREQALRVLRQRVPVFASMVESGAQLRVHYGGSEIISFRCRNEDAENIKRELLEDSMTRQAIAIVAFCQRQWTWPPHIVTGVDAVNVIVREPVAVEQGVAATFYSAPGTMDDVTNRVALCQSSMCKLLQKIDPKHRSPLYLLQSPFTLKFEKREDFSSDDRIRVEDILLENQFETDDSGSWFHPKKRVLMLLSNAGPLHTWAQKAFAEAAAQLHLTAIPVAEKSSAPKLLSNGLWNLSSEVLDSVDCRVQLASLAETVDKDSVYQIVLNVADRNVDAVAEWLANFPKLRILDVSGSNLSVHAHFDRLLQSTPRDCLILTFSTAAFSVPNPNNQFFSQLYRLGGLDRFVWMSKVLLERERIWAKNITDSHLIDAIRKGHLVYYAPGSLSQVQ